MLVVMAIHYCVCSFTYTVSSEVRFSLSLPPLVLIDLICLGGGKCSISIVYSFCIHFGAGFL